MGHRYYDTRIGRFITQDPIHSGNNWYGYCRNNPVNATDPSGLSQALIGTIYVPGSWTQAQIEAYVGINYGDGTYQVGSGRNSYTFTLYSGDAFYIGGLQLGLGVAGQFIDGGHNHNRNYGPTSTQAKLVKSSYGYNDVLNQIVDGKTHGAIGTGTAALYTLVDAGNGTEAQLGAFKWQFTDPHNSNKGIDILNDITFNSLMYHIPEGLNKLGVMNPSFLFNGGGDGTFPTGWSSGNFGTIHQKIHLNFP